MEFVAIAFVVLLVFVFIAMRKLIIPRYVTVQPYQKGVLTNKGVFERILEPGGYWIPKWKFLSLVDMRIQVLNVAGQEVLSSDGLSIKISIAGEYNVVDARQSLYATVQPLTNLYLYAQAAIREVMSSKTFEDILQGRSELNDQVLENVQPKAKALGLEFHTLQIRDIMLSGELKRAFAQVLTAQKEGLGALERARGETATLRNLANAARLMEENPALIQLRALQTMESSKGNTLVLGLNDTSIALRPKS